jgi:septum formation protein
MSEHEQHITLASQSPRRCQLLDQIGIRYRQVNADIDESVHCAEQASEYAARMAREKALAAVEDSATPVLGADTVVVIDGRILGKPESRSEAVEMLTSLSGRVHHVITAVALLTTGGKCLQSSNTTLVEFKNLSSEEICAYCDSGEPMDKAGAYAIQGRAAKFVCRIEGSFSGVMGLPIYETAELLRRAGVMVLPD